MQSDSIAEQVIRFIECLPVPAGKYLGETIKLRSWQKEFIRAVYGPLRDDGRRAVRTAVLSVARRNGKSLLIACLALAHLIGPLRRQNSILLSAANDRFQASIVFKLAADIVRACELRDWLEVVDSHKRMHDPRTNSTYYAISADAHTKLGLGPDLVIYDELGAAPKRELFDVLSSSMGSQAEPLMICISTQAPDREHLFSELVDYGERVNAGEVDDPAFVSRLYTVPMEADPFDETEWIKANPGLGDYRDLDEFRTAAARAKRLPAMLPSFRNLYLNQRVSQRAGLIAPEHWKRATDAAPRIEDYRERPAWGGLDLSSVSDLTALCLVFPDADYERFAAFFWVWVPGDQVEVKATQRGVDYQSWCDRGDVLVTPGGSVRRDFIVRQIEELTRNFDVREIAADRWRLEDVTALADDAGLPEDLFVPFGQGFKDMAPAVDVLESALADAILDVQPNAAVTWCASNVMVTADPAGNRKPTRESERYKIDPIVALMMALRLATRAVQGGDDGRWGTDDFLASLEAIL